MNLILFNFVTSLEAFDHHHSVEKEKFLMSFFPFLTESANSTERVKKEKGIQTLIFHMYLEVFIRE